MAAHQAGKLSEAEFLYRLVLQADKKQFDALHMLAIIDGQRGQFAAGKSKLEQALRLRPKSTEALINLGRMQSELGDDAGAVATYEKVLAIAPNSELAHNNLSIVLRRLHNAEAALAQCEAALAIAPEFADAWTNRGNALSDLGRADEALESYDRALGLRPTLAEAHVGRANVLLQQKRRDEALAACDKALSLRADLAEAWLCRGGILLQFRQHDEALADYDKAIALRSGLATAWLGRGLCCAALGRFEEALAAYDKALELHPELPDVWLGRGQVFAELRQYEEAFAAYDQAFRIKPDQPEVEGIRLHMKQLLCDWSFLDDDISYLLDALRAGQPASPPFPLLAIPATAEDQLRAARRHHADLQSFAPLWSGRARAHDRIRVAYLSSDFREHPLSYLAVGLFEMHDRSRFEITGIGYGRPEQPESALRQRIRTAFEHFIDADRRSDRQVAELLRDFEIDIAVDLNGITQNARPNILARRPAPIQVAYLGYAGTMGADHIDYIVADRTVIPEDQVAFYSEKVVWLPDCFMATDDRRAIAERAPTRGECALPEHGFVFCSFNNSFKISPDVFKIWMRLLLAVPGSVLWLSAHAPAIVANLRREAQACGVEPERLVFAPRVGAMDDHLARHACADLFLDTLPYNAHATANDALWAGLPVLTCLGTTFAGRVAASLDRAVGLGELVTHSLEEYEALALKIAREPALLAALKAKLAANRTTHSLFDTARFTRNIEAAYLTMWQRHAGGEPPAAFAVEPVPAPAASS